MKKVIKKLMSLMLSIVLAIGIIGTIPYSDIKASAATNKEIQNKIISLLYNGAGGYMSCDFDSYVNTPGRHEGIDFAKASGTPIYAVTGGTVINSNNSSSLSTLSVYNAEQNVSVIYLHADVQIANGTVVSPGQFIGYESNKGGGTGAHTHIEIRVGQKQYASKSTYDYTLDNPNPYPYWEKLLFGSSSNNPPVLNTFFDFWGVDNSQAVSNTYKIWLKQSGYGNGDTLDVNIHVDGKDSEHALGTIYQDSEGFFSFSLDTTKFSNGEHTVYAVLRNQAGVEIWREITISILNNNPDGAVDSITGGTESITIKCWAVDHDNIEAQLEIHMYVGGDSATGTAYNLGQTDEYRALGLASGVHGMTKTISVSQYGTQPVYIYAINIGGGINTLLWSGNVTIGAPQYTRTLDPQGGTCSKSSVTFTFGQKVGTLPTPTRTGYTFLGWYTAKTGGTKVTADTVPSTAANATWYAQWKANTYTRTLDPQGGKCDKASITVTYGQKVGTLPTPTKTGYTFLGWYNAKTGGMKVTADLTISAANNGTWYAQWKANTYTRTLDPQGGKCDKTSVTVTYGQKVGTLPTPTKTGYTFLGWYNAKTGGTKVTADTVMWHAANATWYARWTKDKLYGDIYVDDTLNLLDVIYLQKFIIGIKELNDTQLLNADLNSDGRINVIDLALLKKAITA